MRKKLADPSYVRDLRKLRQSSNPTDMAFLYLLEQDSRVGNVAKEIFLSGETFHWPGMDKQDWLLQSALLYDWLYDLMTPEERATATQIVMDAVQQIGGNTEKESELRYYWNDVWTRGAACQTIAALALDNEWSKATRRDAYDAPLTQFGPYGGGALDVLNSLSLSSGGGQQAGILDDVGSGYEGFFLQGAYLFLHAWETATGEPVTTQTTFLEKFPDYAAQCYLHVKGFDERALQTLEVLTGSPNVHTATLAQWLLSQQGRAKYSTVPRLILGDRRVKESDPSTLGLPTCAYLEGADVFVSRSGWERGDTAVLFYARHWDTSRYEPDGGCLAIYQDGQPILVLGSHRKGVADSTRTSGVWLWNEGEPETFGAGSMYWRSLPVPFDRAVRMRANSARPIFESDLHEYRPEQLVWSETEGEKRGALVQYHPQLKCRGVQLAERKIEHDLALGKVTITDRMNAGKDVNMAISLRLSEEPVLHDDSVELSNATIHFASSASKVWWEGGLDNELSLPWGSAGAKTVLNGQKKGYAGDMSRVQQWGLGNVFIVPENRSGEVEFQWSVSVH